MAVASTKDRGKRKAKKSKGTRCFSGSGRGCGPGARKVKSAVRRVKTKVKRAVGNVKDDIGTVTRKVKKKSIARQLERGEKKIERKTVSRNKKTGTIPNLPTRKPTPIKPNTPTRTIVKKKERKEEWFSTCTGNKSCSPKQRTMHRNSRERAKRAGNSTYYIGNKAYATNYSYSKTASDKEKERKKQGFFK